MADNPPSSATPLSRHQRFRDIMDAAAGSSTADYQGYGKFWHLPLPQLRTFELYGVPMMRAGGAGPSPPAGAPPPPSAGHCCAAPPSAAAPSAGGGSAGLVRGLRGQFPFDGTQFPRLPWGGTRVADADIAFIEQWIADGCPDEAEDAPRAAKVHGAGARQALATGQAAHPAFAEPINMLAEEHDTVRVRKNINCLMPEELKRLRAAIAQMKSLDPYYMDERSFAYWARIHANQCQHGWEEFLTWHRVYLYGF